MPLKDDGKATIFGLIKAQIDDPAELNLENGDTEDVLEAGNDSIVNNEIEVLKNSDESSPIINEVLVFEDDVGSKFSLFLRFFNDYYYNDLIFILASIDRKAFQLELSKEEPKIQEPIKNKNNLKRKKSKLRNAEVITVQNETEVSTDIVSPIPVKRRKKLSSVGHEKSQINLKNSTKAKDRTDLSGDREKLKLVKSKKTSGKIHGNKTKQLTPEDIKTRVDLIKFLSKDSYPGLDRLQWNMMTNSIKKFVTKLEKCEPSEEKRQRILLKKVKTHIKNWIK